MTSPQPGDDERREIRRAMSTSVERLHGEAQRLLDDFGPNMQVLPGDTLGRGYQFSPEAVALTDFRPNAVLRLSDEPYTDDDPDDGPIPAQVVLFYRYEDDEIIHTRDTSLVFLSDGRIVADRPDDEVQIKGRQGPITDREVLARLRDHISPPTGPEIFSQAECDRWLKLITEERRLRG